MKSQKAHLTLSIILALTVVSISSYGAGHFQGKKRSFQEIEVIPDINSGVTTLKLTNVQNGKLNLEVVGGKGRIVASPSYIKEVNEGDQLEIPLNQINLSSYYRTQSIPGGALFIASSKGKYYYSVFDKAAYRITEKNRIYFGSEKEAQKSGFKKR